MRPEHVVKRDGSAVPFDATRIAQAIGRALDAVGVRDDGLSDELARVVAEHLARTAEGSEVGLEEVQDAVVHVLQESGHYDVAMTYARYRDARERARRERRARGERNVPVHLEVIDADGRHRVWSSDWLIDRLARRHALTGAQAMDVLAVVEDQLAQSPAIELTVALIDSLVESALVRLGLTANAHQHGDVRVPRAELRAALTSGDGLQALAAAGRAAFRQEAATSLLPPAAERLWSRGRLWVDGLDDPLRGAHLTAVVEQAGNPWQVIAQAAALAIDGMSSWRRVRVVLPPSILGHLERGSTLLHDPIVSLSRAAEVLLYCDGRTPLLERWPFAGSQVGLAIYNDDFLLARQLAERGLPLLSGAQYARGGWTHRVAVEVALNAQGLEHAWSQLDLLAMGAAVAVRARLARLPEALRAGELRFAIYGLAAASPSSDYLERQVVQDGQREGLVFTRAANLPAEACEHLGRLLDG
jgi:hypothetical protein